MRPEERYHHSVRWSEEDQNCIGIAGGTALPPATFRFTRDFEFAA